MALVVPMLFALLASACGATATPSAAPATAAPTTAPTAKPVVIGVTDTEVVVGSWGPQDGPAGAYGVIDRTIDAY